jgi:hypothetical protein
MEPYDYFSATGNFPSKPHAPHYTQPQPQYFQPPPTQEMSPFDVNAFAALSPSSVGSFTITPSLSPTTVPLPTTESPENAYIHPSYPILPPPTSFEGPAPQPQTVLPAPHPANRAIKRSRQEEVDEPAEESLPAPKRRRRGLPNSSAPLPAALAATGVLSAAPAVTGLSADMSIPTMDGPATSWTLSAPPAARRRRSAKRPEDAPSASSREPVNHSAVCTSGAPLPARKYGWLDHLLGSALEGNKRP